MSDSSHNKNTIPMSISPSSPPIPIPQPKGITSMKPQSFTGLSLGKRPREKCKSSEKDEDHLLIFELEL